MSELESWISAVCGELGMQPSDVEPTTVATVVLDVARDVAHGVSRPAAPLTAFLLGQAVGAGLDLEDAANRVCSLATSWNYVEPASDELPSN